MEEAVRREEAQRLERALEKQRAKLEEEVSAYWLTELIGGIAPLVEKALAALLASHPHLRCCNVSVQFDQMKTTLLLQEKEKSETQVQLCEKQV